MFQIKFFVEDKLLGEALKRLAGIARGVEHAYVPNVESERPSKANGHAPKLRVSAVGSMDLFMKELRKRKLADFDAKQAREITTAMGFSPTSYSYMLKGLIESGLARQEEEPRGQRRSLLPEAGEVAWQPDPHQRARCVYIPRTCSAPRIRLSTSCGP